MVISYKEIYFNFCNPLFAHVLYGLVIFFFYKYVLVLFWKKMIEYYKERYAITLGRINAGPSSNQEEGSLFSFA